MPKWFPRPDMEGESGRVPGIRLIVCLPQLIQHICAQPFKVGEQGAVLLFVHLAPGAKSI